MIRVVVVDDDYMVARVHSAFVERTPGFAVVGTAHTGAEALALVRDTKPDLVLLDVYMPDITGLEVLKRLRGSSGPEARVQVVLVTAADDVQSIESAMHGGAVSYLIKPFTYEDLRQRLEHALQVRQRLLRLPTMRDAGSAQRGVDRLFAVEGPLEQAATGLPKGLSPETATLVTNILRDSGDTGVSASECAERIGLSRVTARRYLEHLASVGMADVTARYGGPGRPERRFRVR